MASDDLPAPRIGDRERDVAVQYLQEHHAEGRLLAEEFEERMGLALAARTEADLVPLFVDLPAPRIGPDRPSTEVAATDTAAPAKRSSHTSTVVSAFAAASWPLAIVGASILGWGQFWWLIFIPIFVTPWLLTHFVDDDDEDDDPPAVERGR